MKLLDILLENTLEYRVKFVTIKDKDVSQGSASYKDLGDAKKFFDSLTNDPEVYRAQIDKMLGADSSRDMGAMSFRGGSEEIERYSHPAIRSSKKFDELTPAEQDIRMFANSRLGTMGKKGFTSKDGTYKYLEEGMKEGVKDKIDAQLMKLLDAVGFDKFADVLIDKFGIDGFTDRLHNAIGRMPGGEKILQKIGNMSALKEGMSKSAIMRQIKDAEEILDSGEADGVPLDNETEMLVQQELSRLKKMLAMNEEIPDVNTDFSVGTDFSADLEEIYNSIQ